MLVWWSKSWWVGYLVGSTHVCLLPAVRLGCCRPRVRACARVCAACVGVTPPHPRPTRALCREGTEGSVPACEAACSQNPSCDAFTWCASPATPGCQRGPSCWFYHSNSTCSTTNADQFVSGWLPTSDTSATLWTAYAGAQPSDSDTFR